MKQASVVLITGCSMGSLGATLYVTC
jgi:1-acylglycerone phosphate reductase